jgi:hypothetical protein
MTEPTGAGLPIERTIEAAERSANGESYEVLIRGENYRVGIAVTIREDRTSSFSIELLLRIFESFSVVDPSSLEKATGIIRVLVEREYLVAHEDDGWFCCRKFMKTEELVTECKLRHKIY